MEENPSQSDQTPRPEDAPRTPEPSSLEGTDPLQASQLVKILDDVLAGLQKGEAPDRTALLAAHPELAEPLEACLAGMEFIHGAPERMPEQGRVLGDFRLLREIGRGGMGAVYEAEQRSLGRRVAVKVLNFGAVSDPQALERFKREAETVGKLHHTNIVPVHAVGSDQGVNYYAMQFIDGQSLDQVLAEARGPIDPDRIAEWGLHAAEALAHAHQRGVIHRDVKPSNLIRDPEGRIWLTDFGLAKRVDDVTLSMTGALLGTPRYMSPEQASAATQRIDHRTDVYSLGATLYELVTGRPAFSAQNAPAVIHQILSAEPEPPRNLRPQLPRDLETVLLKCLAKNPEQRYESAKALADDLRAVIDRRPIQARRPHAIERATRWLREHRRSVALTATAVAVTVVAMLAGWGLYRLRSDALLGSLELTTATPPLTAEVINERGLPTLPAETLPMQRTLSVPAGELRLRVSGSGKWSETYRIAVETGGRRKADLRLDDQTPWAPRTIDGSYRIVQFPEGADLLELGSEGVRLIDAHKGEVRWELALAEPPASTSDPLRSIRLQWPWWPQMQSSYTGQGEFDLRPFVWGQLNERPGNESFESATARDLDGDGLADVVLAARHQAWMLAVSGKTGKPLWARALAPDAQAEPAGKKGRLRHPRSVQSAALAPPLSLGDFNGDGAPDLAVLFASADPQAPGPEYAGQRWIEAFSGRDGASLWKRELPAEWFTLPDGEDAPDPFRWYIGRTAHVFSRGTSHVAGGPWASRPQARQLMRRGKFVYVPGSPRLLRDAGRDGSRAPLLALPAGNRIVRIDPRTGEVAPSAPLSLRPGLPVVWGDTDGDAQIDAVICAEVKQPPNTPLSPRADLAVWSLAKQEELWKERLVAYSPKRTTWGAPYPQWPVVEDLDGDGAAEILAPNGTSNLSFGYARIAPYGELSVIDGASGKTRWTRRVRALDQQVNNIAVGPDLNGDGIRDLVVATLWGRKSKLFVDSLSGSDGSPLWWNSRSLHASSSDAAGFYLGPLYWWNAGRDGGPTLIVPAYGNVHARRNSVLTGISPASGEFVAVARDVHGATPADIQRDGADELILFQARNFPRKLDQGGVLRVVQGVADQRWRRADEEAMVSIDADRDGIRDVAYLSQNRQRIHLAAGRTGDVIWSQTLAAANTDLFVAPGEPQSWDGFDDAPQSGDLNGDGVDDLVIGYRTLLNHRPSSPLMALSGKTGRELWRAQELVQVAGPMLSLGIRDLDRDGSAEVIVIGAFDWGLGTRKSIALHDAQLWLAVFSGRNGALKFRRRIATTAAGTGGRLFELQDARVATPFTDLNGDGVLDLLVPIAETEGATDLTYCGISGVDGSVLWRHPIPASPRPARGFQMLSSPLVVDIDGDGSLEVALMTITTPSSGKRYSQAVVQLVDAASGKQRWQWATEVLDNFKSSWGRLAFPSGRPAPTLVRGDAGHQIAVYLRDQKRSFLTLLSADGTARSLSIANLSMEPHRFRCRGVDVNGDGQDEVLLLTDKHLLVLDAVSPEKRPLLRRHLLRSYGGSLVDVQEATGDLPPRATLVWNVGAGGSALEIVDLQSGATLAYCAGPNPRYENGYLTVRRIALLRPLTRVAPAEVLFAFGRESMVRTAYRVGHRVVSSSSGDRPSSVGMASAGYDPRWSRDLPWKMGGRRELDSAITALLWSGLYCITMVLLPTWYLYSTISRGQWGLRMLLIAPLITGIFLLAAYAPENRSMPPTVFQRVLGGLSVTPLFAFGAALLGWLAVGRWVWTLLLLGGTIAASAIMAAIGLAIAQVTGAPLAPQEYYSWDGWHWIVVSGVYVSGLVVMLGYPGWNAWRQRRRFGSRNRTGGASPRTVTGGATATTVAPPREGQSDPRQSAR